MKQNVFFVSGIDTNIGKSYATAYLAHLWNKTRMSYYYSKIHTDRKSGRLFGGY